MGNQYRRFYLAEQAFQGKSAQDRRGLLIVVRSRDPSELTPQRGIVEPEVLVDRIHRTPDQDSLETVFKSGRPHDVVARHADAHQPKPIRIDVVARLQVVDCGGNRPLVIENRVQIVEADRGALARSIKDQAGQTTRGQPLHAAEEILFRQGVGAGEEDDSWRWHRLVAGRGLEERAVELMSFPGDAHLLVRMTRTGNPCAETRNRAAVEVGFARVGRREHKFGGAKIGERATIRIAGGLQISAICGQ